MTLTREPSGRRGITDRRRLVHATSDLADDSLADAEKLGVVAEADVGLLDFAGNLDEDPVAAVHHDIGDVVACQKRLEWAVSEDVVADVLEQLVLLGLRHCDFFCLDDLRDSAADLPPRPIGIHICQLGYVDDFDQGTEDLLLDVIVFAGLVSVGLPPGHRDGAGRHDARLLRRMGGRSLRRYDRWLDHRANEHTAIEAVFSAEHRLFILIAAPGAAG